MLRKLKQGGAAKLAKKLLHPESRKAVQLRRKLAKEEKTAESKNSSLAAEAEMMDRFQFFRSYILSLNDADWRPLTRENLEALTQCYVDRYDAEIQLLLAKRNPPEGQLKQLRALRDRDKRGFEGEGLMVPDVTREKGLELLALLGTEKEFQAVNKVPAMRLVRSSCPSHLVEKWKSLVPVNIGRLSLEAFGSDGKTAPRSDTARHRSVKAESDIAASGLQRRKTALQQSVKARRADRVAAARK